MKKATKKELEKDNEDMKEVIRQMRAQAQMIQAGKDTQNATDTIIELAMSVISPVG